MRSLLFLLLVCTSLHANERPTDPVCYLNSDRDKVTVCLNMIVKDESHVIERCLESVKPFIDAWAILDTGSSDGTQEIIRRCMEGIPGELQEEPFVNFEASRNRALDLAKGRADYLLFIDADETFDLDEGFSMPHLDKDFYHIKIISPGIEYVRRLIVRDALPWRWIGVVHEVIDCPEAKSWATLGGIHVPLVCEGARSMDPQKFQKDAALLAAAVEKDPTNKRNTFYLAQSLRDAQEPSKAIEWYQKRAEMGGWDQEVFWSLLQVALLKKEIGRPEEEWIGDLYKAYQQRPSRAEPLYYIARNYRLKGDFAAGYAIACAGCATAKPDDILFVNQWIYDYGLQIELSVCAYWLERYGESKLFSLLLLAKPDLPDSIRELVRRNLDFAEEKIAELQPQEEAQTPSPE